MLRAPGRLALAIAFAAITACGSDSPAPDSSVDARLDMAVGPDALIDAPADGGVGAECGCAAELPWRCEPCLDAPLQEISAIAIGDTVVVVGGFESSSRVVTTVRRFTPGTGVWDSLPDLPDGRHHVHLATADGALYVIGGMRDLSFEALRRSFVLRDGADAWEELPEPPRARAAGHAAVFERTLVVAGGQGEGRTNVEKLEDAAQVMRFDLEAETWTLGAAIPTPREHVAGVEADGALWILGGRRVALQPTLDTVERYVVARDEWETMPSMPTPHGGFAAARVGREVFVGGGEVRAEALVTFESFDLDAESWSTREPLPSPRHGHAMAALDGRVYLIGGADRPIFAAVPRVESFAP